MPVAFFFAAFGIAGRLWQGLAQKLARVSRHKSACSFCTYNMSMRQLSWKQDVVWLRFWHTQSFMCLDYIFDFLIIHTRQKDRITLGSLTYPVTKLNLSWFALSHAQHFCLCVSRDTCLDWEVQDALYERASVLLSALAGGTSPFPLQTSLSVWNGEKGQL